MQTVLLQITNEKAYQLLEDLEALEIIKVLKKSSEPKQKLSDKYKGKLPSKVAEELQEYVSKSRKEWDNRDIWLTLIQLLISLPVNFPLQEWILWEKSLMMFPLFRSSPK